MIEELHDHLYLKSPHSHDRWKSNAPEGMGTPNPGYESAMRNAQDMT